MKGTALLASIPWLQVSLALHAAFGVVLWVTAPQSDHHYTWDDHTYAVSLHTFAELHTAPSEPDADALEEDEETLCVERDEQTGVYDGPPQTPLPGEVAHDHVMERAGSSGTCPHCPRPTSWKAHCTVPGCDHQTFGGHRCLVARSGCGVAAKPAPKKITRQPATK